MECRDAENRTKSDGQQKDAIFTAVDTGFIR